MLRSCPIKAIQGHPRLKLASQSSLKKVLNVSRSNNPTLLPINNPDLLCILLIKNPDFITISYEDRIINQTLK